MRGLFDIIQGVEWDVFPEPAPKRIHVVRLRPGQKAADVMETMVHASMVLLDSFSEDSFGGTGHKVDWELAAEIVRRSKIPVMLAGGLTPDNVAEAVRLVQPFAVDVSSGVEEKPGLKDPVKVRDFIHAAKRI
jgi:phosphoribosylanthranilate isomerase